MPWRGRRVQGISPPLANPPDAKVAVTPPRGCPVLRGARGAVVFLTRIPAGGFPYAAADWRWASAWFPTTGALVGALSAVTWVAARPAGALVAAVVALTTSIVVTGAFHEDGLADTADAMGGALDRERLFAILKDSRIGVFGGLALVLTVLLRVAALASLDIAAPFALVVVHCVARVTPVWLMAALPYVTPADHARSRPLMFAGPSQVVAASAFAAAALGAALAASVFSALDVATIAGAAAGTALLVGWRFKVRAGGITGDFLGASEQITECSALLALAIVAGHGP